MSRDMRSEDLTMMKASMLVFPFANLRVFAGGHKHFKEKYYLHLQG
jgi:hypothetical protein